MPDGPEATNRQGCLAESKCLRVIRVPVLRAVVCWIMIELAWMVLPAPDLPRWAVAPVIMRVALGFPITLALARAADIGPGGLRRMPPGRIAAAAGATPAGDVPMPLSLRGGAAPAEGVASLPQPRVPTA